MKKILVTGASGFVGFHLSKLLLNQNYCVFGVDNLNNYYDVNLKMDRLNILKTFQNFSFLPIDICNKNELDELFEKENFNYVVNLAAQAGVRFSIEQPYKYIDSNLIGFINILEACRNFKIEHLIFASSSSVYGANENIPYHISQKTDRPLSLYAATKKANELMAYSYAAMYNIKCTGLRFFTVYGPYGRPDMAYFLFTKNILEGKEINVYNEGKMMRDFTYIDDITDAISQILLLKSLAKTVDFSNSVPYNVFNIGNNNPISLYEFIETLEMLTGKKAIKVNLPMQKGDMETTYADISELYELIGFQPKTKIEEGLSKFVEWYKDYYNIS
jgi:UDP-glucuronate 4-epimerase